MMKKAFSSDETMTAADADEFTRARELPNGPPVTSTPVRRMLRMHAMCGDGGHH